ncbi:Ribosomal silencing factor RsfS [Tsuneonella dongtanensis]|uniref:Ribosomal silencing factor RsfS n=1 Tax=Tsuneonella dongtanensis TaxID=692370 RepID=A0A1B2A9X8_9SPHN|nr:ribosome silencing factor [Tsuneonella dongtanensis]ANY18967.1 Ribosomal silencing factor RsfS [Tsuneonella dongtanensis]
MQQAHPLPANAGLSGGTATSSASPTDRPEIRDSDGLHALVLAQLDDDQAQEVVSIPLAGKSSIADFMVIASGRSTRQVAAMAQKLAEKVKAAGFGPARVEGLPAADWVLIDAGDVVVHLFRPEVRSFYNLERMWGFGDDKVAGTGTA